MVGKHTIPKQKNIGGKKFKFVAPFLYESDAWRTAERRRELGWYARVIFNKPRGYYLVYIRRKK